MTRPWKDGKSYYDYIKDHPEEDEVMDFMLGFLGLMFVLGAVLFTVLWLTK